MSHWTRSLMKIKRMDVAEKVAKKMGLKVERGRSIKYRSSYAGTVEADMVVTDNAGGSFAIVKSDQGDGYQTIIDNWSNPITNKVGRDCRDFTREYSKELTKMEARAAGGVLTSEKTLQNEWVELRFAI